MATIETIGQITLEEWLERSKPRLGDWFRGLCQHADAKLQSRIERFHAKYAEADYSDAEDREFVRLLRALFKARRRSPAAVAKRS